MDLPGTPTHGMEHYGEHREVFATPLSAAKTMSDVMTPGDDSEGESNAPQQDEADLFSPATPPTVDELMPPADSESIPATQESVDELISPADKPCEEIEGPLATPKPKRKAAKAKGKAKAGPKKRCPRVEVATWVARQKPRQLQLAKRKQKQKQQLSQRESQSPRSPGSRMRSKGSCIPHFSWMTFFGVTQGGLDMA